jgi:hypothetical protein
MATEYRNSKTSYPPMACALPYSTLPSRFATPQSRCRSFPALLQLALISLSSRIKPLLEISKCASRRLSISFLMSLMSVKRSQRVTSQFLRSPSNSKMNSSTSPRWFRYISRRCCLQSSAVCFWRFLVPNPILSAEFLFRILDAAHYARDVSRKPKVLFPAASACAPTTIVAMAHHLAGLSLSRAEWGCGN